DGAAAGALPSQLDQAEIVEDPHVVADVPERSVKLLGELAGARLAILEDPEDADPQRMGKALYEPRVVDVADCFQAASVMTLSSRFRIRCNLTLTVPSGIPKSAATEGWVRSAT